MFRFFVYLTLTVFFYDASFSALARKVRRVRASSSEKYSRKVRLTKDRLKKVSANNIYRSVGEEIKYKASLKKYYLSRSLETMLSDFEHDYDVALKIYMRDNPGTIDPEEDLQGEINKFLASHRNRGKIVGIKNADTEGFMHIPPSFKTLMKRNKISFTGIAKNYQGNFDLKTLLNEKDLILNHIFPEILAQKKSKNLKKVVADAFSIMKLLKEAKSGDCDILGMLNNSRLIASDDDAYIRVDENLAQSNPEYYYSDDYEDEFITPILRNESMDRAKASEQKGYAEMGKEERSLKNQGKLFTMLGLVLMAVGAAMMINPATSSTGMKLMAAGALLLYLGMEKTNEGNAIEDDRKKQAAKNAEIDAARNRVDDADRQRQDYKRKKQIWRKEQEELRQLEDMQRRQQLQDAANSAE